MGARAGLAAAALMVAALLIGVGGLGGTAGAQTPLQCGTTHWVGAWTADPTGALGSGQSNQTLRIILTPHIGSSQVRVHLSNRFSSKPVSINQASVALRQAGAAIVPGSSRPLTFGGQIGVVIPAGGDVTSDPAALGFGPFQDLAVSLYVAGQTTNATGHLIGRERSYATARASGDHVGDEGSTAFVSNTTMVSYVDEVDAMAPSGVGAAVLFGDSITDGYEATGLFGSEDQAGIDANHRYGDYLERRLIAQAGGAPRLSVLNAGISGNRILADGQANGSGIAGLKRLDSDLLAVPGVTDAVILEGINDIALLASADQVEMGLKQMVARLHAAGVNVLLGTLIPAGTGLLNLGNILPGIFIPSSANGVRLSVNAWIRSGASGADGILDFDLALSNPAMPAELNPGLDSGDHVHPNYAGYSKMADLLDLSTLRGGECVAPPPPTPATVHVHVRAVSRGHLRLTGSLTGIGPISCPTGAVTVRVLRAGRTVSKRPLRLTTACAFARTLAFTVHGKVEIRVGFPGSPTIAQAHARPVFVRVR